MVSVFSTGARGPQWWIRTLHQSSNRRKGTDRGGVSPGSVRPRGRIRLWTRRGLGRTDSPHEVHRNRAFLFPRSPEDGLRKLMNFNKPPPHPSPPSPSPALHTPFRAVRSRQVSCQHNSLCLRRHKRGPQPLSEKFERWPENTRARARDRVTFRAEPSRPGTPGKRPATAGRSQLSTRGSALSILARHLRASLPNAPNPAPGRPPLGGPRAPGDAPEGRSPPPAAPRLGLPRSRHKGGGDRPLALGRGPHGLGLLVGLGAGTGARPRRTNAAALTPRAPPG